MTRTPAAIDATDGAARATTITTARGTVTTPCFMPVGTRGAVRTLDAADIEALDAQIVLANTYHLMLRPGADTVESAGGLHDFTGWSGHVLTDSGGYQVFSLEPDVDDDGVTFRSAYDGSEVRLTPEDAVRIQEQLGPDIAMVLDVCAPWPCSGYELETAVERTSRWAERARVAHVHPTQAQFGIVQGGGDLDLRRRSADHLVGLDFDGYAVGGLSVGEPEPVMLDTLDHTVDRLPTDRPRYLMGVGDPRSIVEAVVRGIDLFDCVLPTRLARHGTLLTDQGRLNLRNARFAGDGEPLDPGCGCSTCGRYSRAYLRHLLMVDEPTAPRLLTLHNLAWLLSLTSRLREAIVAGTLEDVRGEIRERWPEKRPSDR